MLDLFCLLNSFLLGNLTPKTSQRDKESAKSFSSTDPLSQAGIHHQLCPTLDFQYN